MRITGSRTTSYGAAALAAALLGVLSPAGPAGTVSSAPPTSDGCVAGDEAGAARVRPGGPNSPKDPNAISATQAAALGNPKVRPMLAAGSVTVPTYFHVISAEPLSAKEKARYESMISAQMKVMNNAYSGKGDAKGSPATPFTFRLAATDYTVNAAWSTMDYGSQETKAAKTALHQGGMESLNVYSVDLGGGLLGYATFPQQGQGQVSQDGVVILNESMPGGDVDPYSEGDTLVHEAGHWLGLYHTFQNGCTGAGDYVTDTPAEAVPAFYCDEAPRDTCTAEPGIDPLENYMDYTEDFCMHEFTPGQARRMSNSWEAYRQ